MDYQTQLQAKLDAVRPDYDNEKKRTIDVNSLEEQLLSELDEEFNFARYDLQESDILRTLKIYDTLERYGNAFLDSSALKLFFIIARLEAITAKTLHQYVGLDTARFKRILQTLAKEKLLHKNDHNELELTMEGKSLAEKIGMDFFI